MKRFDQFVRQRTELLHGKNNNDHLVAAQPLRLAALQLIDASASGRA
jgi:hypothetical protein